MVMTTEGTLTTNFAKRYCPYCGNATAYLFAEGFERAYCAACDRILYENPIPATCVVILEKGLILLVKRKYPPCAGEWCLPGGFMELHEQPANAALRELLEETGLNGRLTRFLGAIATPGSLYSSLLLLGYAAETEAGELIPGDDALEAVWFNAAKLPPIAFNSHAEFIQRALSVVSPDLENVI